MCGWAYGHVRTGRGGVGNDGYAYRWIMPGRTRRVAFTVALMLIVRIWSTSSTGASMKSAGKVWDLPTLFTKDMQGLVLPSVTKGWGGERRTEHTDVETLKLGLESIPLRAVYLGEIECQCTRLYLLAGRCTGLSYRSFS